MIPGRKTIGVMVVLIQAICVSVPGIPSRMTPLKLAATKGDLQTAKNLVENGADPNGMLDRGFTPLHLAVYKDRYEVVRFLLDSGASTNQWRFEAHAPVTGVPLNLAAYFGRVKRAKLLLDHGAQVNAFPVFPDVASLSSRGAPLHEAVRAGRLQMVKLLIQRGADVNAKGHRDRQSPLYMARQKKGIADYLVSRGAKLSLYDAVLLDDANMVKEMLAAGIDVNAAEDNGFTVLHLAAAKGRVGVAKILIEKGALLSKKSGYTPLVEAALKNQVKTAELLIRKGAVVNAKMLHYALSYDRTETARLLIEHGADVNATVNSPVGYSLLHWCVRNGLPKATRLLLEHGADAAAVNPRGVSVLEYGCRCCRYRNKDIPKLLIEYGAKVNAVSDKSNPPLFAALGSPEMVRYMLELRADPKATLTTGDPLLVKAVQKGYVETVSLLLEYGADPQVSCTQGHSAMFYAQRYRKNDNDKYGKIVALLKKYIDK
ncbi:MAG: ankyrin repeat domain-containing protein [Sedimentisphaerales bacterium]|nr:ankyrin repeat domain-containing protein [Sedimentisphaerales bacterium]